MEALKAAGVRRCVMLNVSGPFHSPMMIPAGEALDQEMADMQWSELKIPYVTNVTAEYVTDIQETRALLAKQVRFLCQMAGLYGANDCRWRGYIC